MDFPPVPLWLVKSPPWKPNKKQIKIHSNTRGLQMAQTRQAATTRDASGQKHHNCKNKNRHVLCRHTEPGWRVGIEFCSVSHNARWPKLTGSEEAPLWIFIFAKLVRPAAATGTSAQPRVTVGQRRSALKLSMVDLNPSTTTPLVKETALYKVLPWTVVKFSWERC